MIHPATDSQVALCPDGRCSTFRRVAVALAVVALGLGVATPTVSAVTAGGSADPVGDALARPNTLDSLGEVSDLADATAGDRGSAIGVVTDSNGALAGGIEVERIVAHRSDVDALTDRLEQVDGVFSAAVARRVSLNADPRDAEQYGPTKVGARSIPGSSDGTGVTVAVLDTGVMGSHQDLTPALRDGRPRVATGTSFLLFDAANGTAGNVDPHGHGTHVAGIINAARDNGLGGSGAAPGAQVLPVRVLNAGGLGWSMDITAGILWAHQQGADVINMSLGATGTMPSDMQTAIAYVATDRSRGKAPTVVVASAGNNGPNAQPGWPARHERVIAVAATDATDGVASFSSRGDYVDVAAPGSGILSTCRDGSYCSMSGTSMASPLVAGAAAILRQQDPARGPDEIRSRLEGTAVDLGSPGRDTETGAGRINLSAAVAAPPTPYDPPTPVALTGGVERATADRRRVTIGGTAFDPDGTPLVRIVSMEGGRFSVYDVAATGGRWEATWEARPGNHTLCAAGMDTPTNDAVLLGCRQVLVK